MQRAGRDGGEVGLDEDVVDGLGQLAGHRRGDRVDVVVPATSARPAVDRAPRPVTPSHSASRSTAVRASPSRAALRMGRRHRSRASSDSVVATCPGGSPASSARMSVRIARIGGQCRSGPRALAGRRGSRDPGPDQMCGPGRRQPGGCEPGPPGAGRFEEPLVRDRGGRPDRHDLAVVRHQAGAVHDLDQPGGSRGVDIQRLGQATQVADRQATGPQDPRRRGTPELDGLLDEGQQVADLATGGGVDPFGADVRGVGVGRSEGDGLVEPSVAQHQSHLAGQQHPRLALAAGSLGHRGRDHVEEPLVQQPAHAVGTRCVPVDDPDRWPPRQPVQHAAGRLGRLGDQGPDLARRQRLGPELERRRAESRRVGAEDLGGSAHRIQRLGGAPRQGEVPEPLELGPDVQPAHQVVHRARARTVPGHDDRLEDLEMPEVQALDRPLNAGAGAGAGGQRGEVGGRGAGEVGPRQDEGGELLVGPTADVVGQAARAGGRRGGRPHSRPHGKLGGVGVGGRAGGHEGNGNRQFGGWPYALRPRTMGRSGCRNQQEEP